MHCPYTILAPQKIVPAKQQLECPDEGREWKWAQLWNCHSPIVIKYSRSGRNSELELKSSKDEC